jgi:hypothetical protein
VEKTKSQQLSLIKRNSIAGSKVLNFNIPYKTNMTLEKSAFLESEKQNYNNITTIPNG